MKKISLILIFFSYLAAADSLTSLQAIMKKLDLEATEFKENIFYQPYILSVYKGEDLEQLGISNLSEALELIPGVAIHSNNIGIQTAIFRGSNPFAYGQSKLFIDGVCVNDVAMDQYSTFLDMPIELIKRIEIIRGPGSRSDDVNTYAGAIYVYTYAESDCEISKIFIGGGSKLRRGAGFVKKILFGEGNSLYIEGYLYRDDKSSRSGKDSLSTGRFGEVNRALSRSGEASLWVKNYSVASTLKIKNFTFKIRDNYYKHGMAYGLSFVLPQKEDFYRFPVRYIEGSYNVPINRELQFEIKSGVQQSSFYTYTKLAPEGIIYYTSPCSTTLALFNEGIYGVYEAKQLRYYAGTKLVWKPPRHNFHIGVVFKKEKTTSVKTYRSDVAGNLIDYSSSCPFLDPTAKRDSVLFYFSDEYRYNDSLTILYGFNIEHNDHTKHEPSPRLALVYKQSRDQIYKISFSRSHRNPSWQELFIINNKTAQGNKDLQPEIVDALEASYIKRFSADDFLQLSLFYLRNSDVINNLNSEYRYENHGTVTLYGIEVELKKMIVPTLFFYGNYSFVDGRSNSHTQLANVAHHMVKAYLTQQITPWIDGSVVYEYIGDRKRADNDHRKSLKGFQKVDLTTNIKLRQNVNITLSIKNIFDEDIRYPAPPNTYTQDYKAAMGRYFMANLQWSF